MSIGIVLFTYFGPLLSVSLFNYLFLVVPHSLKELSFLARQIKPVPPTVKARIPTLTCQGIPVCLYFLNFILN